MHAWTPIFVLTAAWFGCSVNAQEICNEPSSVPVYDGSREILTSPGYNEGENYSNNLSCHRSYVNGDYHVLFIFTFGATELEAETNRGCYDRLSLGPVQLCGSDVSNKTLTFFAPAHYRFQVDFSTDISVTEKGFMFQLDVSRQQLGGSFDCIHSRFCTVDSNSSVNLIPGNTSYLLTYPYTDHTYTFDTILYASNTDHFTSDYTTDHPTTDHYTSDYTTDHPTTDHYTSDYTTDHPTTDHFTSDDTSDC